MRTEDRTYLKSRIAITKLCLCTTSLFVGGMFYVLFRENTYVSDFIERFVNVDFIRVRMSFLENNFTKFYFSDFLWAFSLCCGLSAIFPKKELLSGIISFLCGTFWEFSQKVNVVDGTGDVCDIIMYLAACAIAVMINKYILRSNK